MPGPNLSLLREKIKVVSSLPIACCCAGGWTYDKIVSQSFLSISIFFFFLICLMCKSCLAGFWISFRRNCSMCSYRFGVFMGGGEFRSFLHSHLRVFKKCIFWIQVLHQICNWQIFATNLWLVFWRPETRSWRCPIYQFFFYGLCFWFCN